MTEDKKFYLTKSKIEELKKEYKALKMLRAAKTNEEIPRLLESEDLNPEFISFKEDRSFLDGRFAELENIMRNAKAINVPKNKNIVDIGATVEVEVDKSKDEFTILSTLEADPTAGKISNESPIGQALIGHKPGDEIVVSSPVKVAYKIRKIKYNKV